MKKYKKILIDAILFFVIIGLTLYGVFHGEDLSGLKDAIKECNILWLIPAVPPCVIFYSLARVLSYGICWIATGFM